MTFDWSELLGFAEDIQQKESPSEAEIRAAISRAYYSIHNLAADSVLTNTGDKKGHSDLVCHYKFDKYNTDYQEAGKILGGLKRDRHASDYNEDSSKLGSNLEKKLESVIAQAKEFKKLAEL